MELDNIEQSRDDAVIFIKKKLQQMTPFVSECSIHRVPKKLLEMNPNAYVPKVISIGPFHHDQHNFKQTEELKIRFFNSYQSRVGLSVEEIVENARGWERKARKFYSEPINMDGEEFVKMMVLDGCFIVELMIMDWKDLFLENENKVHSSFYTAIKVNMSVELLMLENQIPFFVLQDLFDIVYPTRLKTSTYILSDRTFLFKEVILTYFKCVLPPIENLSRNKRMNERPCHLLDFLSYYFVNDIKVVPTRTMCALPPTATQLGEAGIVFKKGNGSSTIVDISFNNGILEIPPLYIDDSFEIFARNILENDRYAIDYFEFLDELISTEKDVNLLMKEGIIINGIGGSEKEISQLFNDICKNITINDINHFSDISEALQKHCERRRNRWMASLRHNYFNTPWALISVLAATILILLTVLQTIFSGVSTYK